MWNFTTTSLTVLDPPEPTKAQAKTSKHRIPPLTICRNFMNTIVNDQKIQIMKYSYIILGSKFHQFYYEIYIPITTRSTTAVDPQHSKVKE